MKYKRPVLALFSKPLQIQSMQPPWSADAFEGCIFSGDSSSPSAWNYLFISVLRAPVDPKAA